MDIVYFFFPNWGFPTVHTFFLDLLKPYTLTFKLVGPLPDYNLRNIYGFTSENYHPKNSDIFRAHFLRLGK